LYECKTFTEKSFVDRGYLRIKYGGQNLNLRGRKCGKFHDDELHNLYSSPQIIRAIRSSSCEMVGAFITRKACQNLVRKTKWNRSLGIPRHRWKYDTKIDLKGMWCEDVEWIYFAQNGDWEFFSSPPRPDRLWGPVSFLSNGY
jgi:hypothetical protein